MKRYWTTAIALFVVSLSVSSGVYFLIRIFFNSVFGGYFRMMMYHEQYPVQYLALVSFSFALLGSLWIAYFRGTKGIKRHLTKTLTIIFTIALATPLGGLLWSFHDMQAGYFPAPRLMLENFRWAAITAIEIGPQILLFSFPFNLFGIIYGYVALHLGAKLYRKSMNY